MFKLQPLRFQAGWETKVDSFTEYDPSLHGDDNSIELCEDLLQLKKHKTDLIIDLGRDPNYAIGQRCWLRLIKADNRDIPWIEALSASKIIIVEHIEQ